MENMLFWFRLEIHLYDMEKSVKLVIIFSIVLSLPLQDPRLRHF